jgi:hypothetical protein
VSHPHRSLVSDVIHRTSAALIAKHRMVFNLVRQSPFAPKLFDAKSALVADYVRDLDTQICEQLAATIATMSAGSIDKNSDQLARIVLWSADGIASSGEDLTEVANDINQMVHAVLKT